MFEKLPHPTPWVGVANNQKQWIMTLQPPALLGVFVYPLECVPPSDVRNSLPFHLRCSNALPGETRGLVVGQQLEHSLQALRITEDSTWARECLACWVAMCFSSAGVPALRQGRGCRGNKCNSSWKSARIKSEAFSCSLIKIGLRIRTVSIDPAALWNYLSEMDITSKIDQLVVKVTVPSAEEWETRQKCL
jgi:hypothetical protein